MELINGFVITLLIKLFCSTFTFFGRWEQEHGVWFGLVRLEETPGIT